MAYDNPSGLIAAAVILQVIVYSCVGIRLASRKKLRQALSISDWLVIVATVLATGLMAIQIYGCAVQSFGVPLDGTIEDGRAVTGRLNIAKHLELSYLLLGVLTLGTIKASISFFYLQIFNVTPFRRVIIPWICVLVLWTAGFVIAGLAECGSHLLALFGTPQSYLDHCGSAIPTGWAMVGSDLGTDLITLILPIPMVWSLQMRTRTKFLVTANFLIGSLSVGASLAKLYIYVSASLGLYKTDAIILLTALGTWNLTEVQVGIIAACGPTMRPALKELYPQKSLTNLLYSLRSHRTKNSSSESSFKGSSVEGDAPLCLDGRPPYAEAKDYYAISAIEANSNASDLSKEEPARLGSIRVQREVGVDSAERV